jgi:hypothetical protein
MGDVAGFGAEVALDPLTWFLGPIGGLTKGGHVAAKVAREGGRLKAARELLKTPALDDASRKLLETRALQSERAIAGLPTTALAPTMGKQALADQRALLQVGLPFGPKVTAIRGAPVLEALGGAGRALRGTKVGTRLGQMFQPRFELKGLEPGLRGEISGLEEVTREILGHQARRAQEYGETLGERLGPLVPGGEELAEIGPLQRAGLEIPEAATGRQQFLRRLAEAREQPFTALEQRARQITGKAGPEEIGQVTGLPKESIELVAEFHGILDDLFRREALTGARPMTSYLRALTKSYMERTLTPAAKRYKKELGELLEGSLRRVWITGQRKGSQVPRIEQFLEEFTTTANDFFRGKLKPGEDWFQFDPTISLPQRMLEGELNIANARFFNAAAKKWARPIQAGDMDLADLIGKGRLHGVKIQGQPIKEGVFGIPREVADELLRIEQRLRGPEEVMGLLSAVDTVTGMWKLGLTAVWPAFHVRNFFSDTWLSWMSGALQFRRPETWRLLGDVWKVMRKGTVQAGDSQVNLGLLRDLGVARGQHVDFLMKQAGLTAEAGLTPRHPRFRKAAEKFGGYAAWGETFSRAWHFLARKSQGVSDLDAALSVKKHLFDYSELTKFEREVMTRSVLWYQWTRKVIPRLFGDFLESPSRMAFLSRFTTQPTIERPETGLPEFMRQTAAIPIGKDVAGSPQFLFGMGTPLEEVQKFDPTSPEGGALGAARAVGRRFLTQVNPLARVPFEFAAGKDFFLDEPIMSLRKAEPSLAHVPGLKQALDIRHTGPGLRHEGDPLALYLMRASPASRLARTASQVMDVAADYDPRKTGLQSLLQAITGVRIAAMDPVDQARVQEQVIQRLMQQLQRAGAVGEFPVSFVRKGKTTPELEAQAQQMIEALRAATKRRRELQGKE